MFSKSLMRPWLAPLFIVQLTARLIFWYFFWSHRSPFQPTQPASTRYRVRFPDAFLWCRLMRRPVAAVAAVLYPVSGAEGAQESTARNHGKKKAEQKSAAKDASKALVDQKTTTKK